MNSDQIKCVMLNHFRYERQCPVVALEASVRGWGSGGQSDVLAVTQTGLLIDIEVKVSMGDFNGDVKKRKHIYFRKEYEHPVAYFYFAVPEDMAEKVAEACKEKYPYAGVIGTNGETTGMSADAQYFRKAKRMTMKKLKPLELAGLVKSQSATLCRLSRKALEPKQLHWKYGFVEGAES